MIYQEVHKVCFTSQLIGLKQRRALKLIIQLVKSRGLLLGLMLD